VTALLWYRRDLRVHDLPALRAALDDHDTVAPVFCFDDGLLRGRHASGNRTRFMLQCLTELEQALRDRGGALYVRHGRPERELRELAAELGAREVHYSRDVSPFSRRRLESVRDALAQDGIELIGHPGLFVIDALDPVRTGAGKPYTVFTPFFKNWSGQPRREVIGAPRQIPAPSAGTAKGRLPTLADLGLVAEASDAAPGGESEGRTALSRWINGAIAEYADERNALGADKVSRLSPYLHFGCLSPREIEARLPGGQGAAAWRRQLCWRDFYAHVLGHFPANAKTEFQERYRGTIRWSHAEKRFEAWCDGRTGYPVVDAAMRQLRREGWMHNRARLVVGSFLTKDLGIDWRWGERWFMRHLIDGDEASNNGNWQWIASVGVDPAPAFQRMFNPSLQQQKFDPDGRYVRRYVPELADVPDEHLAEPWRMPAEVQERVGCRIGRDYPEPMVDHRQAREEALARYRV
jgi:deoxyribodipyrimidine photo-lyase